MPKISVVMPTCNTPVVFLKEAVESILNQSFYDFEFIIIDDGSSNEAPSYLDSLSDRSWKRIWMRKPITISTYGPLTGRKTPR